MVAMPPNLQWRIKSQITSLQIAAKNTSTLPSTDRAQLLYEIAWRHKITHEYIAPWLAEELFQVATADKNQGISKIQKIEIALILLKK